MNNKGQFGIEAMVTAAIAGILMIFIGLAIFWPVLSAATPTISNGTYGATNLVLVGLIPLLMVAGYVLSIWRKRTEPTVGFQ